MSTQLSPQLILQMLLQQQQQTQQPQDDKELSQGQAPSTPAPEPSSSSSALAKAVTRNTEPDDLEPITTSFLRGFISQNSQRGELPAQSFDQQFRQSVSPAREMLSNALLGMGASMTGQKFRSLREQKFEEYVNQQKLQLEQQQQQQQQQQHMATIVSGLYKQRQEEQVQKDIADAKAGQSAEQFKMKYGLDIAKYGLAADEFKANQAKAAEAARHNQATETKVTDSNYQQAFNEVKAQYDAKEVDLSNPQVRPKFLGDVSDRRQELDQFEAQVKKDSKEPKAGKTTLVFVPGQDGQMTAKEVGAGQTVPQGTVTPAGMSSLSVPTQATRTMAEKAPRVEYFVDRINQLIDDNEKQLGPLKGRMADLQTGKIGLPNRGAAQLRTDLGLLQTALMNMHVGARGGSDIMHHFGELLGGLKQDPENTRAVLSEIKTYAQEVQNEGRVKAVQNGDAKPVRRRRFNTTTGQFEDMQ